MQSFIQKIITPRQWPLRVQIILGLILALVLMTQIATQVVNRTVTISEKENLMERSHHTVVLTSAMLAGLIEDQDTVGLNEFVNGTILQDAYIAYVEIIDSEGTLLMSSGNPKSRGMAGFIDFSDSIIHNGQDYGRVNITWREGAISGVIATEITRTRALTDSFLTAISIIILIGVQFLIIRPLSALNKRIIAFGDPNNDIKTLDPLSENQSQEWLQLSKSTNLLQTAIVEKEDRENELMLARDLALQTSQIKTDLLTNISHEFRTPLNGILGLSELLLTTDMDEEQQDYAESILESGNNLLETVTGMLDLSTLESDDLARDVQPFDLVALVQKVVDENQHKAAEKELPISFQPEAGLPAEIRSDPQMVCKVLVNLVDNAIRFTDQGAVAVTLSATPTSTAEQEFTISVVDTGIGIPLDQQARIFESFTQADSSLTRSHQGNGLGLAISKGIAQKLGGEIQVESEVGSGSTFKFIFSAPVEKFYDPENTQTSEKQIVPTKAAV